MYDRFKKAVFAINPELTEGEWEFLKSDCSVKEYRKGDYFIKEGDIQTVIGFLNSGFFRGYYINDEGDEITIRFVKENDYVIHYSALINNRPSRYYYRCLQNCSMILLPMATIREGYVHYKGLERFGRLIAEQVLSFQESRIEDFQFLNAEERYLKFVKEYPNLFNRVSLTHLSSYLGVQRPSLSRIRKKIVGN